MRTGHCRVISADYHCQRHVTARHCLPAVTHPTAHPSGREPFSSDTEGPKLFALPVLMVLVHVTPRFVRDRPTCVNAVITIYYKPSAADIIAS